MLNESLPAQALLAVFPDRVTAERVAERLADTGIDRSALRIDAALDEVTSLEAEVMEESNQSASSPTVGVAYPKETVKAGLVFMPPAVAIGAVLGHWPPSPSATAGGRSGSEHWSAPWWGRRWAAPSPPSSSPPWR